MNPDVFQQIWDFPNAGLSSEGRFTTNVPPQRLFFLNSSVIYRRAADLAERVPKTDTLKEQIRRVYELAYQRDPTKTEMETVMRIVQQPPDNASPDQLANNTPLKSICWAVLSSNELLYID